MPAPDPIPVAEAARPGISLTAFPEQYAAEREAIHRVVEEVFSSGRFVGGEAVEALEEALAGFCGTAHAVCVNSGTDALMLALIALGVGPGDEVITPANSFVASTAAIVHAGAVPVFADVADDQNIDPAAIEAAVTARTKAIMPVHLTGRICDMAAIGRIANRHGLAVIEDAAQSIGSRFDGRPSGGLGTVGCFSTHPLKNLNAAGDGGFVTTDDAAVARAVRLLRNHGLADRNTVERFGFVSRMDTLQAALLLVRLPGVAEVVARRRENAALYRARVDPDVAFVAPCRSVEFNSFHLFVVQVDRRDALQSHLADLGIRTGIHYPVPIHLQPAARGLGYAAGSLPATERQAGRILSLPVHQFLSDDDIGRVADAINGFLR